jgi:acetolactate synthase-1/2/3 large subunit
MLLECLQREGVEVMFGYPGGVVLPIYDKLIDCSIRHYLVRHEQNACFAAQGYARSTGKVGVCMATSGPGATNLVTGLTDAHMDSIPIVAITGQVSTKLIGNDAFQEADTVGITRPCTKHNYLVKSIAELPLVIKEAFYVASTGRPGPVLVDLPKDVLMASSPYHPAADITLRGYRPPRDGQADQIRRAAALIWEAERPVIYTGGGIIHAGAFAQLRDLAEMTEIPVTNTLLGLGGFPTEHPLSLGMLGMHGRYATNTAVNSADLLVALGVRFDDRVTGKLEAFARHARIIHVDIDPAEIGKNVKVDVPIVGDVKHVLEKLNGLLLDTLGDAGQMKQAARAEWRARIAEWQRQHPLTYEPSAEEIKPQFLMEELDRLTYGRAVISTDVGQHQMWAAQYFRFNEPRRWVTSGGLGSMGFGVPAAIGAAVANPDKISVALVGDGGFQMSLPELGTIANYNIPVKIIIMNNQYLGMVRQWQDLFYNRRYSEVEFPIFPDCEKLAASYGLPGRVVDQPGQLVSALEEALNAPGPYLLDVRVAREENVYPIVPAGAALSDMIVTDPRTANQLASSGAKQ